MGIVIDVEIRGLEPLIARLDVAPALIEEQIVSAIQDSTDIVREAVEVLTPMGTGRLRASERTGLRIFPSVIEGRVYTDLDYAPYVEEGHGEIRPRRARILRFTPKGSIEPLFRPRVKPVAGVHMFRRGLEVSWFRVVDRFGDAMKRVARFIAG